MNKLSDSSFHYINCIKKLCVLSLACMAVGLFAACGASRPQPAEKYVPEGFLQESALISFDRSSLNAIPDNPNAALNVPTYITKVEDTYFIVDCYNNQVIYHDNLTDPLYEWQIMTKDISMGHTLASDGLVYLIDDTENNRVLVMEKEQNENGQTIYVPTHFGISGTAPTLSSMMHTPIPFMCGAPKAGKCICSAIQRRIPACT